MQTERKKERKESKVSSLIVLLLVVEETDGPGLQSEGVKVGGGEGGRGWTLCSLLFFVSFVKSPNSLWGKKKKKV